MFLFVCLTIYIYRERFITGGVIHLHMFSPHILSPTYGSRVIYGRSFLHSVPNKSILKESPGFSVKIFEALG